MVPAGRGLNGEPLVCQHLPAVQKSVLSRLKILLGPSALLDVNCLNPYHAQQCDDCSPGNLSLAAEVQSRAIAVGQRAAVAELYLYNYRSDYDPHASPGLGSKVRGRAA